VALGISALAAWLAKRGRQRLLAVRPQHGQRARKDSGPTAKKRRAQELVSPGIP
jgi:hypothetical protein